MIIFLINVGTSKSRLIKTPIKLGRERLFVKFWIYIYCNEHGTIYAISSDFGDRMIMQSMGLMVLLSEHF